VTTFHLVMPEEEEARGEEDVEAADEAEIKETRGDLEEDHSEDKY